MTYKPHKEDSNATIVSTDDKLNDSRNQKHGFKTQNFTQIASLEDENMESYVNPNLLTDKKYINANMISMEDLSSVDDDPNDYFNTKDILLKRQGNDVDRKNSQIIPQTSSSCKITVSKSRQSFSMTTKIFWVKEFQACPQGTNMRKWLEEKNISENTRVSYTSFRRWNMTLKNMTNEDIFNCSSLFSKKNYRRPHSEMEKVLVEFLRIRNHRLRAFGRRKSTPGYIKAKAMEFYEELYGDDSTQKFKASNGWLGRFQDSYIHLLDPEFSKLENESEKRDAQSKYQSTENIEKEFILDNDTESLISDSDEDKSVTLKDMAYLQQVILDPLNNTSL